MVKNRDFTHFTRAIQKNCDISDASGAGLFSICGMALRLRDMNRWENGFKPWEENDPAELIDWIDRKEQLWESLEGRDLVPLPLFDKEYDPLDTVAINEALSPLDLFYGAGYAHFMKPTFFLAKVEEFRNIDGIPVILLGKETLRDLLTIPALNQDHAVLVRREAAGYFLWDQMVYLKKSGRRFLNFALRWCGLRDTGTKSRRDHFSAIRLTQEQTYIHHEIGEMRDTVFDHGIFREIVSTFPHTTVELLARTVKDLLADTGPHGTLQHIIVTQNAAGLCFYAAFQEGLFLPLFPQLRRACDQFTFDRNWEEIEDARQNGFSTAKKYARELVAMFCNEKEENNLDKVEEKINRVLVKPLLHDG